MNLSQYLPKHTIRISDRAKQVRLLLSLENGLEVIVPPNYDPCKIPDLLNQKQAWISRNQAKLNERRAFLQAQNPHELPQQVHLRSLQELWQIEYQSPVTHPQSPKSDLLAIQEFTGSTNLAANLSHNLLKVSGDSADLESCRTLIKRWLRRKAEIHLTKQLDQVSVRLKLPYRTIVIRAQKTLWGSCSRDRNISLNYKLLFLEPEVVEYVLIHELCHTVYMNHSSKFWRLVEQHQPNYKILDKSLNQAWQIIPAWLDIV